VSKSQFFTIFLLKNGFNAANALEDDHDLQGQLNATRLPAKAVLYVLDAEQTQPWWRGYFGIKKSLLHSAKGAIVFLPVKARWFALCFGHVSHNLREDSYEHGFGLTVTLNSVDPKRLKSTDILEPGAARRRRTQVPMESDLTFFDFDRDSTILTMLTGKVKDEHRDLFRYATGSANLRISSAVASDGLPEVCARLLGLYDSNDYKTTFPDIHNIQPVRDPVEIAKLDTKLVAAVRAKDKTLILTIPDMVNYEDDVFASFGGSGLSKIYDDVGIVPGSVEIGVAGVDG
jgi:uncharacterized protein (TIGR04141 family)